MSQKRYAGDCNKHDCCYKSPCVRFDGTEMQFLCMFQEGPMIHSGALCASSLSRAEFRCCKKSLKPKVNRITQFAN